MMARAQVNKLEHLARLHALSELQSKNEVWESQQAEHSALSHLEQSTNQLGDQQQALEQLLNQSRFDPKSVQLSGYLLMIAEENHSEKCSAHDIAARRTADAMAQHHAKCEQGGYLQRALRRAKRRHRDVVDEKIGREILSMPNRSRGRTL